MENWQLQIDSEYSIRSMSKDEFDPLFQKYTKLVFDDASQVFRLRDHLDESEKVKIKLLSANLGNPYEVQLGLFHKNEFVGWHYGRQDSATSFYMQNSGILENHRRKGLYAALVKAVLEMTVAKGFQSIWSRHNATNNAVIIPKLKFGFAITALEVSENFGTLVHLKYFPKTLSRKIMDYRVGQIKPDQDIKSALGL